MDINELLTRGIDDVIVKVDFEKKLATGMSLRIKMGFDPTKPDIHLGHMVGIRKLQELQDAGHTIIFLIGDYTARIGDPSGKNTTRPVLSEEEIKKNAQTYLDQIGKILDVNKIEVRRNSEWFAKMDFGEILKLAAKFTVAQIIERDDFAKRLKEGNDISLHEILYPLMQAYDSVQLKADVEFGGADQRFNLLAGRELQKKMGQNPQDVVMVKLLVGLDGREKMSKSLGNYIAITDAPSDMFGKVMSIPDNVIVQYFELCTDLKKEALAIIEDELVNNKRNPREIKAELAKLIVETYYDSEAAENASAEFDKVFKNKELPTDIEIVEFKPQTTRLDDFIAGLGIVASKSEARRLIEQGAVSINNEKKQDPFEEINLTIDDEERVVKVGPKKFMKVVVK